MIRLGAWLLIAIGMGLPLAAQVGSEPVVRALELRADAPVERSEELRKLVVLDAGELLREDALRRSLRNLQSADSVGQAEVWTEEVDGGLRVIFSIYPKLTVAAVGVTGEFCVRESLLSRELVQKPHSPLRESQVVRGVYRLQDLLQERGYRQAIVRVSVAVDRELREADVVYSIQCGSPTMVERVEFVGNIGALAPEVLEQRLRIRGGERARADQLREDAERLRAWLYGQGFRTADVQAGEEAPTGNGEQIVIRYAIDVGPHWAISIRGFDVEKLRRRGLLELLDSERFDEALLAHVLKGIRRFLQQQGYHHAEIESRIRGDEEQRQIEIAIETGPRLRIDEVTFTGNETIPDARLTGLLATRAAGTFAAGSGRLVDEVLEEDLANLKSFYALQGFVDAQIGPAVVEELRSDRLRVRIPIQEGLQQRLVALEIDGVTEPSVRRSLEKLPLKVGGAFHQRLLEDSLDEIRSRYSERGYLAAQVSGETERDRSGNLISVRMRVLEGPQVRIGRLVLRGRQRTRLLVLEKALGLKVGEPIDRRRLLEGQRRLHSLGIFHRAEVQLASAMPFATERDVLVKVEEGQRRKVSLGAGYDSEDGMRLLAGASLANLGGWGISSVVEARVSERDQQYRAFVRQPFLGSYQIPVTYTLFGVEENRESFLSLRRGVQIEAVRHWERARSGLLLTYKNVRVEELEESGAPPLFTLDLDRNLRESQIFSLTPSLLLDRRDDPLVPTRGWTLSLQSEYAFPSFDATARFLKLFGQQTAYLPLGRYGVFAASLRAGAIEPIGETASDSASLVPISEQLFAGGRSTHRAYRRDLLGTGGETVLLCERETSLCGDELPGGISASDLRRIPLGGNGLLLLNLDYRFPITGPFGGTVFVDAGNVWPEWSEVSPDEFRIGAGVGLRYLSPIGPLRFEIGWKLDREAYEPASVVYLSFGEAF